MVPQANCTDYPPVPLNQRGLSVGRAPLPLYTCKLSPAPARGYAPPLTKTYDNGALFGFLLFYSPNAFVLNKIFQSLGTLCFMATWERINSAWEYNESTKTKIYASIATICKKFLKLKSK